MNVDDIEYRCGVCNQCDFTNVKVGISFKCHNCETEFTRDNTGIMIGIGPSKDWKKQNIEVWESIKKVNCPPKYIEIFTL